MRKGTRISIALFMAVLFVYSPPAFAGSGYRDFLAMRTITQRQEQNNNRWIEVPGRGPTIFYAQTNPLWAQMRYENASSRQRRMFGNAGCAPTSVAIAVANLLPAEKLGLILPYACESVGGFGIATNAVNPLNTNSRDGIYWFNAAEEYQTYLPLVFGQYATGNNWRWLSWRISSIEENSTGGTNIAFITQLCDIYGLSYTKEVPRGHLKWSLLKPIMHGAIGVALANTSHQPFVASKGHYVAVVGADSQYLYIMDPQDKLQYDSATDKKNVLEVLESGLVRVKHSDFKHLFLTVIYVLSNEDVQASMLDAESRAATLR